MYENILEYYFPKSIPDAVNKLSRKPAGSAIISTGTINLTWRKLPKITTVIDISRLGLSYIKVDNKHIRIGATTTLQDLIESKPLKQVADGILTAAANAWSSKLQRNLTPIGGILENFNPTADIITALLALEAQVIIQGKKTRIVPISEFYPKPWLTVLKNEFIREIIIPKSTAKCLAAFDRIAIIASDISIINVAVAAQIQRGLCRNIQIAVGGGLPIPKRIPELEKEFIGQKLDSAVIETRINKLAECIQPISDFRATAEYRRKIALVLLKRALFKIAGI
ncbi:MAG: xanthine dehydrogenase family protein subunit M [bacterium]